LTNLKEKVVNTLSQNGSKSYEEELQHLDNLIEDLFKMDEESLHVVTQKEASQNS
jgi:hypothetical protein